MSPELVIRLKRHPDDTASLTCLRRDGSATWQRQRGSLGYAFPPHDLTHYAVETTLGFRHGFYGLIAEGWDISDFGTPWPRGRVPAEAAEVERLVSAFQMQRTPLADPASPDIAGVTPEDSDQVRTLCRELLARWSTLGPGETMQLEFDRARFARALASH